MRLTTLLRRELSVFKVGLFLLHVASHRASNCCIESLPSIPNRLSVQKSSILAFKVELRGFQNASNFDLAAVYEHMIRRIQAEILSTTSPSVHSEDTKKNSAPPEASASSCPDHACAAGCAYPSRRVIIHLQILFFFEDQLAHQMGVAERSVPVLDLEVKFLEQTAGFDVDTAAAEQKGAL